MADQTSGDAAPQNTAPPTGIETKDLPHGYAPAVVPYSDSTHLDREAAERDQEVGSAQGSVPTGTAETGGDAKTTTRKSTSKS